MFGKKKMQPVAMQPQPDRKKQPSHAGLPPKYCKMCGREYSRQDTGRKPGSCDNCYHKFMNDKHTPPALKECSLAYHLDFDFYAEYQVYFNLFYHQKITREAFDAKVAQMVAEECARQDANEKRWVNQRAQQKAEKGQAAEQRLRDMYGI